MRQSSRLTPLYIALLSSLPTCLAQINTTCPASVQSYNASGLLGFFDSIVSNQAVDDSKKPTIDNDGYLYSPNNSSPSPPASFAYAITFSTTDVPSDSGTLPAVLTTLLGTTPSNRTLNATMSNNTNTSPVHAVACGLTILNLPVGTTFLGQDDDGTCTSTLPHGCAKKILKDAADASMQWPNDSNELERVCAAYGSALENALNPTSPTQSDVSDCQDLFIVQAADSVTGKRMFLTRVVGFSLTSSSYTEPINQDLPYQCNDLDVVDGTLGRRYVSYPVWNDTLVFHEDSATTDFETMYEEEVRRVYPIITLILREPENDTGVDRDVDLLSAHLGCVRTTGFSEESKQLPALKGRDASHKLGAGAIAGIVVGVVVGLAAIGWGVWRYRKWKGVGKRSEKKGKEFEMEVRS